MSNDERPPSEAGPPPPKKQAKLFDKLFDTRGKPQDQEDKVALALHVLIVPEDEPVRAGPVKRQPLGVDIGGPSPKKPKQDDVEPAPQEVTADHRRCHRLFHARTRSQRRGGRRYHHPRPPWEASGAAYLNGSMRRPAGTLVRGYERR